MGYFNWHSTAKAYLRQEGEFNYRPAICGRCQCQTIDIGMEHKEVENGWWAIQRIPNAGYKKENCLLVCYKCYLKSKTGTK